VVCLLDGLVFIFVLLYLDMFAVEAKCFLELSMGYFILL